MSSIIEKKAWPEWFQLVWDGEKTYEYRLADFDIEVGDLFVMKEYNPDTQTYTGRVLEGVVGYIGKVESLRWDKPEDRNIYPHYILSLKSVRVVT